MPDRNHLEIQPFIDYLKFEKRYSYHTVKAYHDDLLQFVDYLTVQYDGLQTSEIIAPIIKSWLADLKGRGLEAKSLNRKISVLRSYFKFLMKSGKLEMSPMATITAPKIRKRLPSYVKQPDMHTLLTHVEFTPGFAGLTERLAISIFYQTGMRLSELVGLRESQVDFSTRSIKVLGKGNKERILPVSAELLTEIDTYIKAKSMIQVRDPKEGWLLLSPRGIKLYPKFLYLIVKKYLGLVTTMDKKSPHILRHTFATHLMNNGANLNAVKELLGHTSLAATQVYTHNTIAKLQEVHKKAHPKG